MNYIKSLFLNMLVVFFANHILPGIDVVNQTKLPHLGGDLPFAVVLGLLNSLIFPALKLLGKGNSPIHIAMIAFLINFLSYALLKLLPIGIHVLTVEGYFLTSIAVSVGSFLTNFLEMKHTKLPPPLFPK